MVEEAEISRLADASDAVLIPSPGTVPGSREQLVADPVAQELRVAVARILDPLEPRRRQRLAQSRQRAYRGQNRREHGTDDAEW